MLECISCESNYYQLLAEEKTSHKAMHLVITEPLSPTL